MFIALKRAERVCYVAEGHDSIHQYSFLFYRDTFIVSLANSATSMVAGFVIFSAIGYMAHIHNLPVDDIATDGKSYYYFFFPLYYQFLQLVPPIILCVLRFAHIESLELKRLSLSDFQKSQLSTFIFLFVCYFIV